MQDSKTDPWEMKSFSQQLFSLALDDPEESNRESFILIPRSPRVCGDGSSATSSEETQKPPTTPTHLMLGLAGP